MKSKKKRKKLLFYRYINKTDLYLLFREEKKILFSERNDNIMYSFLLHIIEKVKQNKKKKKKYRHQDFGIEQLIILVLLLQLVDVVALFLSFSPLPVSLWLLTPTDGRQKLKPSTTKAKRAAIIISTMGLVWVLLYLPFLHLRTKHTQYEELLAKEKKKKKEK